MHVLIVSQYFWPEEFRINDLATELVRRGHRVTVLTGQPNYPMGRLFPDYRQNPEAFSRYNGVEIIRVPLVPRGQGALRLALNYASFAASACTIGLWKLRNVSFDVIFSPQLSPVTAMLPAVLLRKLRRRKFVMWVLDLWPDTLQALGIVKSPKVLGWVGRLVGFIYHRTDKLYVQSRGFIPHVLKYARRPLNLEYLPNWSEEIPALDQVAAAPQVPVVPGSFNVMFAGAIGEAQGFEAILDAAEQLRDEPRLRWLIVGDGRVSNEVADEAARRGLDNFMMLGRHPVEQMPSFYKHADVMLVSLRADPIFAMTVPGKVQSYLAAAKPVIAMLDGEGAKVITEAGAGISVASGDAAGLAQAVRTMMALDLSALAALGAEARRYSDTAFGREKLIDRIEADLRANSV